MYPRTGSGEDEDSGWRPQAGHRRGPGARRTIVETGNILTSRVRGSLGDCQERAVVAGKQSQVKESCQALCL